ncbi:MAG: twin-arginine translocation signal domain-containing protein, partial [Candidatus Symbiothrix sp.]|nr:twin-arginine translocation signal domain-containing protein [Candidatus Symbiothrix sp.]
MITRRNFLKAGSLGLASIALSSKEPVFAGTASLSKQPGYVSKRPELSKRNFTSKAVEETITQVKKQLKDPKLAWMF